MTLAQLQTIVGYAIGKYGGESEVSVDFLSDQHPRLNNLDDGRINDITINKPKLQSSQVVMWLDLP